MYSHFFSLITVDVAGKIRLSKLSREMVVQAHTEGLQACSAQSKPAQGEGKAVSGSKNASTTHSANELDILKKG